MVSVTIAQSKDELTSGKNPMVTYLLQVRENHARQQKYDYSHVFRRKTKLELVRLSIIAMAIEFAYAAETSFVSPILLQIGIDHTHMTMIWGISPLIGFFLSPLLGTISDRCKSNWGRRRPIITILSIGILIGLILVPHGEEIGRLLGDTGYTYINETVFNAYNNSEGVVAALLTVDEEVTVQSDFKFAVILTIVGLILLDLDADTCQTPARTYLLDMCLAEEQTSALRTFTLLAASGGTIGYTIGGIDWEMTSFGSYLGGNISTVFGIVTIIFIISYIITITALREIPLKLMEEDELLRPISETTLKREMERKNTIYYIKETTVQELQMADKVDDNGNETNSSTSIPIGSDDELNINQNGVTKTYLNALPSTTEFEKDEKKNQNIFSKTYLNTVPPSLVQSEKSIELAEDSLEFDEKLSIVSFGQYLKTIVVMPRSMQILCITNLFCWMSHVTYCLYFTDFVGEAVFNGDPTATDGSEAALLYEQGVRFGCWGMAIYAGSCCIYSIVVNAIMKRLGTKVVYISGMLIYGVGMLILGLWPTKWGVLVFSITAGILYGTLYTMPYILVASYHSKNCFRIKHGESIPLKQNRGLGTDIAIISSMIFIAQLVVSLFIGPLVAWMQTTCAILYASTVLSFIASIFALFVLYV